MADNNQNPTTEEHVPTEAAVPESPGAVPGDVVVDIGTIDELMKKRNAAARNTVEKTEEPAGTEQAPEGGRFAHPRRGGQSGAVGKDTG